MSPVFPGWYHREGSNLRPTAYQAVALPAELQWHIAGALHLLISRCFHLLCLEEGCKETCFDIWTACATLNFSRFPTRFRLWQRMMVLTHLQRLQRPLHYLYANPLCIWGVYYFFAGRFQQRAAPFPLPPHRRRNSQIASY